MLIIAVTSWTGAARLVRGETHPPGASWITCWPPVRWAPRAGASCSCTSLPNLLSILAISLTVGIGGVILAESALSFLNLGVQPPAPPGATC
ncbi:MAG: hypothetical protein IPK19_13300 [Chloroflexi bacterium]|nr:hypothetical protein [Chloroflexota bacterium]